MKTFTFVIKSEKQSTEIQAENQKESSLPDLPGFLRDRIFVSSAKKKGLPDTDCFQLVVENENVHLIFNGEAKDLSVPQTLQFNKITIELSPDKQIPVRSLPNFTRHQAIIPIEHHEDNFFTKRDILADLGFNESKKTDLRRSINFLDYCFEKNKFG